ncbi:MAG: N-acetylneuraminate synthase family protein [Planctomycetota bacterium]|jgi:sialic acid synthase SpsE
MSDLEPTPSVVTAVTIGRHKVGPGESTFIVAEAGVNHNGDLATALRLVDLAVDAGADAVKFQMFRATELVTASAPRAEYQQQWCGQSSQRTMLAELELSQADFEKIREHCDKRSILFLATPFSEGDVARLCGLGVEAIKIASTDLTNNVLLDAAAATGVPMILSTGASTADEIRASVDHLRLQGVAGRLVLLHCVSCYPAPVSALNLRAIASLRDAFLIPCGLSDHSLSTMTGAWAVAAGASALEKHFTLDRAARGPDHAMSLDATQLAEYIVNVREAQRAMGRGELGMSEIEREVRTVARKSVVSARVISAGTRITADMLTLKRPGSGIPAGDLGTLIGREATIGIAQDTMLSWDMVR